MIKLIGACLTVAACSNMGLTWARVFEKRTRQLISLEGAIQLLETEILYGATPLPEAMEQVSGRCDSEVAALFGNTAEELRKMEGMTAGEAWGRAVNRFLPETALNDHDLQILRRLGSALGVSDRDDQAKHLQLAKSQLKISTVQAETAARKNVSIYKYLGFLGGLLLVLVLY